MSGPVPVVLMVVACLCAATAAGLAFVAFASQRARSKRRATALGPFVGSTGDPLASGSGVQRGVLVYAERLSRRLLTNATEPLAPSVRAHRAGKTRAGAAYKRQSIVAGCSKDISVSAFCEARLRLALAGAAGGFLLGVVFSFELSVVLGVVAMLLCRALPMMSVRRLARERALGAELHLSEMLEVVALGLRSGMTFDRSFALYGVYFDNEFAQSCTKAHRRWSLGLVTREEALRDLSASYDCEQLSRVVDSMLRSLRFGSALAGILEEASSQSRASYRATLEEKVAKAPVKMMLPTGTLILPAMLLMVMGPILLELAGGF